MQGVVHAAAIPNSELAWGMQFATRGHGALRARTAQRLFGSRNEPKSRSEKFKALPFGPVPWGF